jgi:hypothetical protein
MKKMILIPTILLALLFSAFQTTAQTTEAEEGPTFQEFIQQFPAAQLPYTFASADLQAQLENQAAKAPRAKRLAWDFYEFLPELERSAQYSNMPVHPEPVASFQTEEYIAVLYNIARGASKNVKTYSITVFDLEGNYIGTNFVAGLNAKTITAATIDASLRASVTEYQVNWANNFAENGFEDNQIVCLTERMTLTLDLTLPGNPDQIELSVAPVKASVSDLATADIK